MIIVAQRFFSQQHAEVLVLMPAEKPEQYDLGVIVYDPTQQKIEEADQSQARHLGTLDLLSAFRHAVAEMQRWAMPDDAEQHVPVSRLVVQLDAFLGQMAAYAAMDARWAQTPAAV